MSKVHKGSNKIVKNADNVTVLIVRQKFFSEKKKKPKRCKKVTHISGEGVPGRDFLPKGFNCKR